MGKRGPQPWKPTEDERRLVEHYVAIGYTQPQIAALMGKSEDSLQRYCRDELDLGQLKVNAKIGGKLFQKAMSGDTASLIFWAKTRMGWKETDRLEHTGPGGGAIPIAVTVKFVGDE
jgi:hypothetical protein